MAYFKNVRSLRFAIALVELEIMMQCKTNPVHLPFILIHTSHLIEKGY